MKKDKGYYAAGLKRSKGQNGTQGVEAYLGPLSRANTAACQGPNNPF
jgi:hypothetical protein